MIDNFVQRYSTNSDEYEKEEKIMFLKIQGYNQYIFSKPYTLKKKLLYSLTIESKRIFPKIFINEIKRKEKKYKFALC